MEIIVASSDATPATDIVAVASFCPVPPPAILACQIARLKLGYSSSLAKLKRERGLLWIVVRRCQDIAWSCCMGKGSLDKGFVAGDDTKGRLGVPQDPTVWNKIDASAGCRLSGG
jgi:hypothetical protein